jgi:hypothetical protein
MVTTASSSRIFFRFQGDSETPTANISIPKQQLQEDAPESLLAKLADGKWNEDPDMGTSFANPIIVHPLQDPYKELWSPAMTTLIADAYEYFALKRRDPDGDSHPVLKLPPDVEFRNALGVLDYYGLSVDDPHLIQLDQSSDIIQMRAGLFLKQVENMEKAKDFIIDSLKKEPDRVSYFLFANSRDDIDFVQEIHQGFNIRRIGDEKSCHQHWDWAEQEESLRQNLILALEEVGLKVSFKLGRSMMPTDEWMLDSIFNLPHSCENGKCWMFASPPSQDDQWHEEGLPGEILQRYVLRVEIPKSPKK